MSVPAAVHTSSGTRSRSPTTGCVTGDSVIPRAQPFAACSRRPDQLRRISPRRGHRCQRRRRDLRRSGRAWRRCCSASWCSSAIALNGRRLGKPSQDGGAAAVPSATAYVTAMGQLFARSRQRGPIAARYADELKRRIGKRHRRRLASRRPVVLRRHRGERAHPARCGARGTLLAHARALAAGRPEESELLRLARDVDACERQWTGAPVG